LLAVQHVAVARCNSRLICWIFSCI
jgi:hypothetical protein